MHPARQSRRSILAETYGNRHRRALARRDLVAEQADGLRVWDQWKRAPVGQRTIRWHGGQGTAKNDGDAFFVIEGPPPA